VRVILIDVIVVEGLADVVVVVVLVLVVVLAVVLVLVLLVGFVGNIGNVGPSDVVSSGNSIPVMAPCFCDPNRPNVCGDAGLCSGLGGKSSHLC
jgi:hypothetical protein